MKKSFLLVTLLIVLVGCANSKFESNITNSSSSIENSTSESKEYYFEVYGKEIRYVNNGKQIELRGTGKPNSTVTIYKKSKDKGNKIKDSNIGTDSKFLLIVDAPELMEEYFLTNGSKDVTIKLYSEKEFLKLQEAEKNKMLEESRESEEKQKVLDSQSEEKRISQENQASLDKETQKLSSESTDVSTTTPSSQGEKEIISPSDDQKLTIVTFTQMDLKDRGYNASYGGKDSWNVVINYIDGKNKWIITKNDKQYNRIKAIYEWDGEKNSGATITYLLIDGKELVNNLR